MVQDKRLYDGGIPDISYQKCHKFLHNNSLAFNEAIERKCNVNIHWSGLYHWGYTVHVIHFYDKAICHSDAKTSSNYYFPVRKRYSLYPLIFSTYRP